MCKCGSCKDRRKTPEAHVCRWVCICGNLIKEEPQHRLLPAQTMAAIGECCADMLPEHLQNRAMPIVGVVGPHPTAHDQRAHRRSAEELGRTAVEEGD